MRSYKQYAFSLFLVALILGLSLCFVDLAFSISNAQEDCDFAQVSTFSTTYVLVPNSSVTLNNGTTSRRCVIQFSAEATASDERMDIAYVIDSTNPNSCLIFGPSAFHSGTAETHTNISVANLGTGMHTIRPCFRGTVGFGVVLGFRCLTVECRTQ